MARKPGREEYIKIMEISGAGLLFIGFLGFAIYLLFKYVPTLF
jgi:protein transport protein SEC61 subunit gamma-like protein